MARKFLLQILLMLLTLASLVNKELPQKFIVSSNGMLLKGDSTSRLAIKSIGSWSAISFANSKLFVWGTYVLSFLWVRCMWYVLYEEHVCSTFLMRNRKPVPHRRLTTYMSLIQNVPHTCSSYEIYHIHTPHIKLTSYMSAYQILFPDTKFTSQLLLTQALSQNFMNNVIA